MASELSGGSERATHAVTDCDAPVVLDGEGEQVEDLTAEVSHKLDGLATARKTRPWTRRRFSDTLSVLEEDHQQPHHTDDEYAGDGTAVDKNKSRLASLIHTFKNDDKQPTQRATFKPIRLAVAKAKPVEEVIQGPSTATAAPPVPVNHKKTTLALPTPEDAALDATAADADDNDDAASYLDFARPSSPTASYTSNTSSVTSEPESEGFFRQWINKPLNKSGTYGSSTATHVQPESPQDLAPESSVRTTTTKWKRHSKKSSKLSSHGDPAEELQAIDYAELDTTKPKHPKRSDTVLGGMVPTRSESFSTYKRNNSLRIPRPFRRRRRKGKRKKVDDESSSEEGIDDEELFHETLRKAGLFDKDVPGQVVTEMLWQNERG